MVLLTLQQLIEIKKVPLPDKDTETRIILLMRFNQGRHWIAQKLLVLNKYWLIGIY